MGGRQAAAAPTARAGKAGRGWERRRAVSAELLSFPGPLFRLRRRPGRWPDVRNTCRQGGTRPHRVALDPKRGRVWAAGAGGAGPGHEPPFFSAPPPPAEEGKRRGGSSLAPLRPRPTPTPRRRHPYPTRSPWPGPPKPACSRAKNPPHPPLPSFARSRRPPRPACPFRWPRPRTRLAGRPPPPRPGSPPWPGRAGGRVGPPCSGPAST